MRESMSIEAYLARKNLLKLIEQVNLDNKPILITSDKGNVVLISERLFNSIKETDYLLSTHANRKSLEKSFEQARSGKLIEIKLEDIRPI
jgi:antitoxin YefM